MRIECPSEKTECFFVLTIGLEAILLDEDPSKNMDPSDADHLYKEIVAGVYYPITDSLYDDGKKIVGFFYDSEENDCLTFYNNEFFTDAEWKPISNKFVQIKSLYERF